LEQNNFFCTWSGGHDSCLSLYHTLKLGQVKCLISPLIDTGISHKTSHFSPSILRAQADLLKIPLLIFNTSNEDFEENYKQVIMSLKKYKIYKGTFPFISNESQKEFMEKICSSQNIRSFVPLWDRNKEGILSEFLELGFKAKIISVNEKFLTRDFLSRDLDFEIIEEFRNKKVDLFGENGEFQTIIYNAPFFSEQLNMKEGDINLKNGNWILDINLIIQN